MRNHAIRITKHFLGNASMISVGTGTGTYVQVQQVRTYTFTTFVGKVAESIIHPSNFSMIFKAEANLQ